MNLASSGFSCISGIHQYRTHIFVFFVALFIGLSIAHPSVLVNDEFITTNQLHQLHAGHQILINEGKYGLQENGSMSRYFANKGNLLGYTLVYPLISLPAFWMIDLSGENCVYFILCLWTFTAIILILMINRFYSEFSYFRNVKWTPAAIAGIFILFFINLRFYSSFPVDTYENYPEIIALVITNIILFSIAAVLMYEINRTIFQKPPFSFFGTLVCIFSSSYFVWVTHGKDHILVLSVFVAVFLCLIRLMKTDDYWYLPLAFILCGLLAWIRPELAIWIFFVVGIICIYCLIQSKARNESQKKILFILCSPLFTLIGSLPFFLNNFMITKNFLVPVGSIYQTRQLFFNVSNSTHDMIPTATESKSVLSVIQLFFTPNTPITPTSFISDLAGIFFYPTNGSVSITALVPLFMVMVVLTVFFLFLSKNTFTSYEKKFLGISILISVSVFFAYISVIHILNTDQGIAPDIRYLCPAYLPLTIIGLMFLIKINILQKQPAYFLKWLFVICLIGGILSLILLPIAYVSSPSTEKVSILISRFFSIYGISICILSIGTILVSKFLNRGLYLCEYLILLLCLIPLFWQINSIFVFRSYAFYAGYTFWIPIVRVGWEMIVNFLLLKIQIL